MHRDRSRSIVRWKILGALAFIAGWTPVTTAAGLARRTASVEHRIYRIAVATLDTVPNVGGITTDTGDFAPGHRDFTRYTTSELCYAATLWARDVLRRNLATHADSATMPPWQDTTGSAGTAAVAHACMARFGSTSPAKIGDPSTLLRLALQQHDLNRVRTLAVAAARTGSFQTDLLNLIDYSVWQVHPADLAAATLLVHLSDSLCPPTDRLPTQARLRLLAFSERTQDSTQLRAIAETIVERSPGASRDDRETAYRALVRFAAWAHPDSLLAVTARYCHAGFAPLGTDPRHCVAGDTAVEQLVSIALGWSYTPDTVSRVPPLAADYWFPVHASDTLVPSAGVITVIVHIRTDWIVRDGFFETNLSGNGLRNIDATLGIARWLATYDPRQVHVIGVATTHGTALFRGIVSPAEEAQADRWFVQDFLRLPIAVAVRTVSYQQVAPPDERRYLVGTDADRFGSQAVYYDSDFNAADFTVIDNTGHVIVRTDDVDRVENNVNILLARQRGATR